MYKVIVGIDFGSSGTGYAYSFKEKNDIILGKFAGQGISSDAKVPTEIILDKFMNVVAFGYKCEDYIKENKLKNGELHFQKIKMNLYSNKDTIEPENSLKFYPLVDIISKVLQYVKKEAIKNIRGTLDTLDEDDVKWIVTVPAIWNLSQKGIMIKACENAGLFNNHTTISNFFALEPEAASLYCSQDSVIDSSFLGPETVYIVCDLGGGTGDFVTHKINSQGKINEIYRPIGGNYGSDEINKQFFDKVIYQLFGIKDYNTLYLKNKNLDEEDQWGEDLLYYGWIQFQKEIQSYKRIAHSSKNKTFFLNCHLFKSFTNDIKLKNLVSNYNGKCLSGWEAKISPPQDNWVLELPYKIFFDLIEEHASKISEKIVEIYDDIGDIDGILYVGGYCANEVLISKIKEEFPQFKHLNPIRPEIAVVKGAVLFGLDPNIITVRKAKYTIGLSVTRDWDDKIHKGGNKKWDEKKKKYRCTDCFDAFIKIGQNINIGEIIEREYYTTSPRICLLSFYKTLKKEPVLTSENEVEFMGMDELDLGKNYPIGEEILVQMKFGGTFVEAKCIHLKSKTETKNLPLYFEKK